MSLESQMVELISAVSKSSAKPSIFVVFLQPESKPKAQVMVTPRHVGPRAE